MKTVSMIQKSELERSLNELRNLSTSELLKLSSGVTTNRTVGDEHFSLTQWIDEQPGIGIRVVVQLAESVILGVGTWLFAEGFVMGFDGRVRALSREELADFC